MLTWQSAEEDATFPFAASPGTQTTSNPGKWNENPSAETSIFDSHTTVLADSIVMTASASVCPEMLVTKNALFATAA
jgi:hypothetical protein